jgi:hypothetical protein
MKILEVLQLDTASVARLITREVGSCELVQSVQTQPVVAFECIARAPIL